MSEIGPPHRHRLPVELPDRMLQPPKEHNPLGAFVAMLVLALLATVALGVGHAQGGIRNALSLSDPVEQSYTADGMSAPALPVRGPLTDPEISSLASKVSPTLVDVNVQLGLQGAEGAGTGIVLSGTGEVLTNNHVINGATAIKVTSKANGRSYPASVVGYDRSHDIAVLQIKGAPRLRTATIGNSDAVSVGDPIAAIGNAGGAGGKPKIAPGQVVSLGKSITTSDELSGSTERLTNLIEVAAVVEPGDSGGPLVNANGQVIGVTTAASVNFRTQTPGGKGYAIPINDAMDIARQIRAGSVSETVHVGPTAMLGVTVLSSSRSRRGLDGDTDSGAPVASVIGNSPAGKAGLSRGDVIVSFDGTRVDSANTLTSLVGQHRPGDQIQLIWQDHTSGQQQQATVSLAQGPPS
ncbi:S1C family serine protease [Pseudonocardia spinosispora]|uniref:S1C family serine protease n=1 Tax=Pseudonocardia spinosispora TaxID=103441 RepID=UPI000423DE0F|nr:trypsin-like peptidase domain-containing protein [Pseudonocardia spinosispora]